MCEFFDAASLLLNQVLALKCYLALPLLNFWLALGLLLQVGLDDLLLLDVLLHSTAFNASHLIFRERSSAEQGCAHCASPGGVRHNEERLLLLALYSHCSSTG